ncbi:MAG TPA: phosphopentomutase [Solirubrobacteraceae bacterium]|nr:phosphopentomutase [Solirubrobacteraceae bacterium]
MRRAFVIVLDACGVGALPDARAYGDNPDSNTLEHVAALADGLELPVLGSLGLGNIEPIDGVAPSAAPVLHGRVGALGPGKESVTGHWELMGVIPQAPLPTYPQGFPDAVVSELERASGRRFCCNRPYSGTQVIDDFGEQHLRTGELILYTSADSVLQIAAHHDVIDEPALHDLCAAVREVMRGEHAVGRVIARPFIGEPGAFVRTSGRHDYSLVPPSRSYLEELQAAGVPVHGVGKIRDLFAGVGIDTSHPGATNLAAIASVTELMRTLDTGLVFANFVDTDQIYGHRHDVPGFAAALRAIDDAVGGWLEQLGDDDMLVLTADHGVDPTADHTDHTREYAMLLARFDGDRGRRHDGPLADVGASVLRWLTGRDAPELPGEPFS